MVKFSYFFIYVFTNIIYIIHNNNCAKAMMIESSNLFEFISSSERQRLKDQVKSMFYHSYYGYMVHAFPIDELNVLDCTGRPFEPSKVGLVTLVDGMFSTRTSLLRFIVHFMFSFISILYHGFSNTI